MTSLLQHQVMAMRASAMAIAATADAILTAITEATKPVPGTPCEHPAAQRTPTPRMGAPEAWRCVCGQEGDG